MFYFVLIVERAAKMLRYSLHAQTNTEDGFLPSLPGDNIHQYATLRGQPRTRAKYDVGKRIRFFRCNSIVSHHGNIIAELLQIMVQVVRE